MCSPGFHPETFELDCYIWMCLTFTVFMFTSAFKLSQNISFMSCPQVSLFHRPVSAGILDVHQSIKDLDSALILSSSLHCHCFYCYLWVALSQTFWPESNRRDVRVQEQKDDGTICTIGEVGIEGEWQREGETSTCLMVIGDITYTNNEAEDDNIFCMMSVSVKAVLTQQNGTLNHPQAADMYAQWHAQTHLNTHACTKRFHFTFSSTMSYKVRNYKERRGTGSLCKRGICLVCQSIYKHSEERHKFRC